jgi:EAL domain-containing protein (putative c-di-GMP-specific phosphodiesterase class I)
MEALLRWHSGTFGDVSPGEFIPIAEESNAVARIVDWTMENAFTQIRQWKDRCGSAADGLRVAVNIPPKYIGAVDFASRVKSRMHKGDVRPEWVNMEITERGVLDLELPVIRAFDELSSLGVTISIDDFGTGYSPLPSLRRMRASTLKIAKELVDAMAAGSDGEAIVKAVVMMAEGLGIHVLAEGVETEEQLDKLRAFGCHGVQGYHFGRPVPAAEFEATYLKSPV